MTELFTRTSLRSEAMISLMAKSGLRPEMMGNHNGTDRLCINDLPDITIHQKVAKCTKTPSQIIIREELSKARHQYFTFLTATGTKKLVAYLNERLARGESLQGNSPVSAPDHRRTCNNTRNTPRTFLQTRQISKEIRKTFRPRFQWSPYVLQVYFDTQLLIAESKGKLAHDFRVFFMGHKGSMEARYTTNKGLLPEMLTSEMHDAFARSEEFLDLENSNIIQKQEEIQHIMNNMVQNVTSKQLDSMLEILVHARHNKMYNQKDNRQLLVQIPQKKVIR